MTYYFYIFNVLNNLNILNITQDPTYHHFDLPIPISHCIHDHFYNFLVPVVLVALKHNFDKKAVRVETFIWIWTLGEHLIFYN